jgi:hypothetical protein
MLNNKIIPICLLVFLIIFFRLFSSYFFNTDYARDLYQIIHIAQGHPTLIGPWLSAGFFTPPTYYYFFLPPLIFSGFNAFAPLVANALLFVMGIGILTVSLFRRGSSWAVLGLLLSPFFLISARGVGNAYSYLPFLLIFLCLSFLFRSEKMRYYFSLGVLAALAINFHPISLVVVLPVSFYLFINTRSKNLFLLYLGVILLSFSPLILFEMKHDLVITKNFLFGFNNNFIPHNIKQTFWENTRFILAQMNNLFGITPLFYLGVLPVLLLKLKIKTLWSLYFCSVFSYLFTLLILRFQFEPHYLFPACTLLVFTAVVIFSRIRPAWLTFVWLILLIPAFPFNLYHPSARPIERYSKAVDYVIKNKILSKNTSFNVLGIIDSTNKVVNGNEYRFFLAREGYKPLTEWEYSDSQTLLVFSEDRNYDLSRFNTWETGQFGQKYFANAQTYDTGDILIYKITKQ